MEREGDQFIVNGQAGRGPGASEVHDARLKRQAGELKMMRRSRCHHAVLYLCPFAVGVHVAPVLARVQGATHAVLSALQAAAGMDLEGGG